MSPYDVWKKKRQLEKGPWSLTFLVTSVSGDWHPVEILFSTQQDATRAREFIETNDSNASSFSITPWVMEHVYTFDEWKSKHGNE